MDTHLSKSDYDFLQTERGEINKRKADNASSRNLQPWFMDRLSEIHYKHFGIVVNQHCTACKAQAFYNIHALLEDYERFRIEDQKNHKRVGREPKPWNVKKATDEKAN